MDHSKVKRTHARAPTRVFTIYAILLQAPKTHGVQGLFAALCITRVVHALTNNQSMSCKVSRPSTGTNPFAYAMMEVHLRRDSAQEGGGGMDFVAIVDHVITLLRQRGRVAYRTLQRQFQLDDEALEDLKIELIDAQHLARDEHGRILVWVGDAETPLSPAPSAAQHGLQAEP
jgi:hypothetical protein